MKCKLICALILVLSVFNMNAQLTTSPILSSHMVLQQGQKIPVWGTAAPGEQVRIILGKQSVKTQADIAGNWIVELEPMKADKTSQQLIIKGEKSQIIYEDILVGEVWLCGGQSNMQYTMKLIPEFAPPAKGEDIAALELKKPANPMIRVFLSDRGHSWNSWQIANGKSLADISAAGYFFGKEIQEQLDVPVGIISAALGGARIETWTPVDAYKKSVLFAPQLKSSKGKIDGIETSQWYNNLIAPLVPFAVKGFLWYQGENNCAVADRQYAQKYQLMVNTWRELFHVPDAPFYSVILAPYVYSNKIHRGGTPLTAEELPFFREQQKKGTSMVSNSDYVVVSDLIDDIMDIHPPYKWEIGRRLACLALTKSYSKEGLIYSGPRLKEAKGDGKVIVLTFEHAADGLKTRNGKRLDWFEIAGSDGVFRSAVADFKDKDQVVVSHPEIRQPTQVRLGWHETSVPNLMNSEGWPAAPFGAWKATQSNDNITISKTDKHNY